MNHAVILLGTNTGSLLKNLEQANELIRERVGRIEKQSRIYETEPWGISDQPVYLNRVCEISTSFSAHELMDNLLAIEKEMGRERLQKWAPRLIDLDILYFNKEIIDVPGLVIPHPHLHERRFALVPLEEILPKMVHPVLNKNHQELLSELKDSLGVKVLNIPEVVKN